MKHQITHIMAVCFMWDLCDPFTIHEHCDSSKQSSFYSTYTSLCKDKNVPALLELIKSRNKLDFVADRIRTEQWEMICKSLDQDNMLEFLEIRSRKSTPPEKRFTTIAPLIRAVSGCVKRNFVLTKLALEGLPLSVHHAISRNSSLKSLSFARSNIMDEGCNVICSAVKDRPHIEKLNLSKCQLTTTAAVYISELIKFQTINRNSEGWMKSLRYRDVDVDSVPGLKSLILNGNPFRDDGLELIASRLKEDMWMKAIEIQNCEITDVGGEAVLDCLKFNKTLVVFDASHNYKISNKIHKKIQMILSTEPDHYDTMPKVTNFELRERMEFLEQQLQLEIFNRERADDINIQLQRNLVKCDEETAEKSYEPPSGYKIVQSDELNALYKEIEDLTQEQTYARLENLAHEKPYTSHANEIQNNGKCTSTEQSGFGDTFASSERKTYASFIPFCRESKTIELDTSISFTHFSQESSSEVSSKFEEDVQTLNSDDEVFSDRKQVPMFEGYFGPDQYKQENFGDGNYERVEESERNDFFSAAD